MVKDADKSSKEQTELMKSWAEARNFNLQTCHIEAPVGTGSKHVLNQFQTSDSSRKNGTEGYVGNTTDIFRAYETKNPNDLPVPQCVQFEITNLCTTGCRMCHRWTWTSWT